MLKREGPYETGIVNPHEKLVVVVLKFTGNGGGRVMAELPTAANISPTTGELSIPVNEKVVGVIVAAQAGDTAQGKFQSHSSREREREQGRAQESRLRQENVEALMTNVAGEIDLKWTTKG
uniref:DUF2382 domain-containing protein n=1 Tax=Mesocestoides corti TaxID=53468 RepID=A0A5K3G7W2_MESCO